MCNEMVSSYKVYCSVLIIEYICIFVISARQVGSDICFNPDETVLTQISSPENRSMFLCLDVLLF